MGMNMKPTSGAECMISSTMLNRVVDDTGRQGCGIGRAARPGQYPIWYEQGWARGGYSRSSITESRSSSWQARK